MKVAVFQDIIICCDDGQLPPELNTYINSNDINAFFRHDSLFTPLKLTCLFPALDHVVRFLLDNGARADLACRDGYTPLHTLGPRIYDSRSRSALNILHMLVAAGADVNALTHARNVRLRCSVLFLARHAPFEFQCALIDYGARMTDSEMMAEHMQRPVRMYLQVGRVNCLDAARTILLCGYQLRERTLLHECGKDIVRLLAQWVWSTRRDAIWCEE